MEITHIQLEDVIKKAHQKKVATFVWGATGIGKSAVIRKVAEDLAAEKKMKFIDQGYAEDAFGFIDLRLSQMDPSDLRGLPGVTQNKETCWFPPSSLPKSGSGILLLDEINLAPGLVQASGYQLIRDRRLGDYKLPDGYSVVAAGNRMVDGGHTFELAGPLCNRFIHVTLRIPEIDAWVNYAISKGCDSRIATFLKFKPSFLFKYDPKAKDGEHAFPSPRVWLECCSPMLEKVDGESEARIAVSASCGDGVAAEFIAYFNVINQINLDELLAAPEKVKEITRPDQQYSVVSLLADYAGRTAVETKGAKKADIKDNVVKAMQVIENMNAEYGILFIRLLRAKLSRQGENLQLVMISIVQKHPSINKYINKHAKFLLDD